MFKLLFKKQVSRAIGDGDYKPLVTAQPDITTIKRNGTEDFLVGGVYNFDYFFHVITFVTSVACDGLWDTITPEEATRLQAVHSLGLSVTFVS